MIKKLKINYFVLLVFVISCGYQPLYSNKNINFNIAEISIHGENLINKIITNKLKNYQKNEKDKIFNLEILSKKNKITASKDSKGNPKTFRLELHINAKILDKNNKKYEKNFINSVNYNNSSNKFNLKKYEKNLINNLANKSAEDLLIYLQTL